jgi:hypothetical protein
MYRFRSYVMPSNQSMNPVESPKPSTAEPSDRILEALSDPEASRKRALREYRQGYPTASEEELELLSQAEAQLGYPPRSLEHAKQVLGR